MEYPYYINGVYANENTNGYYFDFSNFEKYIRKMMSGNRSRLTINCWNINIPRNKAQMKITQSVVKVTIGGNKIEVEITGYVC